MFAVVTSSMDFPERPANVHVKNLVGLFVMALIEAWAHVQLAVLNPNVCILFALNKTMSIPKGTCTFLSLGEPLGGSKNLMEDHLCCSDSLRNS